MNLNNKEIKKINSNEETITFIPPSRSTLGIAFVKKSFGELPALKSPDWIKKAILYEIYVRNFSEQGTFKGVIERLPYLKELGINTLWLMPIHPIGIKGRKGKMGCPYAIREYFAINPEYGDEKDFKNLVDLTHKLEMRLILDLVINHSANDHILINEKTHWWQRDINGNPTRRIRGWKDVADFNFQAKDLWNYLLDAMKYWVEKFDIDGYRCDVAGMVPHEFWEYAIPKIRKIKSDVFFLAEWEDPIFHLKTFNSTYNWTLYFKMIDVIEKKCSAQEMFDAFLFKHHIFPKNSLKMNFVENHDMKRTAKVFGSSQCKPFVGLIFTLPGIPLIYNGQEAGYSSFLSLFERQPLRWKKNNLDIFNYYKDLIKLRRSNVALQSGNICKLQSNDLSVVAFYRKIREDFTICVFNFSERSKKVTLDFPDSLIDTFINRKLKPFQRLPQITNQDSQITFEILPWESLVLAHKHAI